MFLRALLDAVPTRGNADRAALAVHSTMLEHGFVCVGCAEPHTAAVPAVTVSPDGSVAMQVLPTGWNAVQDCYSFGYFHPLRGAEETFSVKALSIGSSLQVHAASSLQGSDLLSATLEVATGGDDAAALETQVQSWQEKVTTGIATKLLQRHNSTARFGKALAQESDGGAVATNSGGGTKRPAPPEPRMEDDERSVPWRPGQMPDPGTGGIFVPPGRDPFGPSPNPFWMPGGGLLGPRHPAWGQMVPGRGGGMMPRFDPIGPGMGEPDPDHLRVPGIPDDPRNRLGPGRRMDPDGMFIM